MNHLLRRGICTALTLGVLVSCASCAAPDHLEEEGLTTAVTHELIVEKPPVVYSEEQTAALSARACAITERALLLLEGLALNETQRQKLQDRIQNDMIPLLTKREVYPSEAVLLLDAASAACTAAEAGTVRQELLLLQLYQKGDAAIGPARIGAIAYDLSLLWLDSEIRACRDRFEAHPQYTWYEEDALRLESVKEGLVSTVGEAAFGDAVSILTFFLSNLSEAANVEENTFALTSEETLALLRLQSERFASAQIAEEQWSCIADLLSEWYPEGGSGSLLSEELRVLNGEGYFSKLIRALPSLLALYRSAVAAMTAEDVAVIQQGTEASARTVARLFLAAEAELSALLNRLEEVGATASDAERAKLKYAKLEESYAVFAEQIGTVDRSALQNAVLSCAAGGMKAGDLRRVGLSYLHSFAPYLAFALSQI